MVDGRDGLSVVGQDAPFGSPHRLRMALGLRIQPQVDLAAGARAEVVVGVGPTPAERVGAGQDGLGLEHIEGKRGRHLAREHTPEVVLEPDTIDEEQAPLLPDHAQVAAVAATLYGKGPLARNEGEQVAHVTARGTGRIVADQLDAAFAGQQPVDARSVYLGGAAGPVPKGVRPIQAHHCEPGLLEQDPHRRGLGPDRQKKCREYDEETAFHINPV